MRAIPSPPLLAIILAGLCAGSCTSAKKNRGGDLALLALPVATPLNEAETVAALKEIADSANANLPANSTSEDDATTEVVEEATALDQSSLAETAPPSWKARGLNPDEVNPGDVFSDKRGRSLHKVMSLLDELPPSSRNPLLNEFTRSKTSRIPLTLSRTELAELAKAAPEGTELPTRSVALDFRMETHAVEPDRFGQMLTRIASNESVGGIAPPDRLTLVRKQLGEVKRRLREGETLHVVTSVGESSTVLATYPGAPVGKRDAEPIRNAVESLYPHAGELEAEKTANGIELTGHPRIVWEFETSELRLDGEKLLPVSGPSGVR